MPQPTPGDVHVNAPLTNISVAYIQQADVFVADKVFPIVPVAKQSDRYFKYNKGDWNRVVATLRGPAAESAGGGFTLDNTPSYAADVYAVHKDVDDQTRANQDPAINMDRDATEWVTQQLLMKRDKVWSDSFFKTGVWGTDLTGVSGSPGAGQFKQWDASGSTPIDNITQRAIAITKATGYRPNVLVLGAEVYNALRNHPDIVDRLKYGQTPGGPAIPTLSAMAALFDLDRIVVAYGVENTAIEGAADSFSFILGKHALLTYANPSPSLLKPSGGYIFSWNGYLGAGPMGNRIKRFRMDWLGADRIEGEMAFDCKLVASDLGVFFSGAVA